MELTGLMMVFTVAVLTPDRVEQRIYTYPTYKICQDQVAAELRKQRSDRKIKRAEVLCFELLNNSPRRAQEEYEQEKNVAPER